MSRWYVLFSKPRKETQVKEQLEQRGIVTFLPMLPQRQRRSTRRAARSRPMFPRYLFAQLEEAPEGPAAYQWLVGVTSVVRIGNDYATVDDRVIAYIKRRLQIAEHKVHAPFEAGQSVRLPPSHPLGPLEAIFEQQLSDGRRAHVLIEIMGRLTRAEVELDDLDTVG